MQESRTSQVENRRRCRSWKAGFGIDAACLSVPSNAGVSAAMSTETPAASRTPTTGAGRGWIPDAVAGTSLVTATPTLGGATCPARRVTSRGESRCNEAR